MNPSCRASFLLAAFACVIFGTGSDFKTGVERFRAEHKANLLADDGPLTLAGRFPLKPGKATFGAAAENDIVLPVAGLPSRAGSVEVAGDAATVRLDKSVCAAVNGKPVTEFVFRKPPPDQRPVRIDLGPCWIEIRWRKEEPQLLLRDKHYALREHGHEANWYPPDEQYRVAAAFVPFQRSQTVTFADSNGSSRDWQSPGLLRFRIRGRDVTLEPITEGSGLFIVFRDATAGGETYGAGRFLDAPAPRHGKVVLDFNRAYNPLCAYNPLHICPRPPRQNILDLPIPAGEKVYDGRHHER